MNAASLAYHATLSHSYFVEVVTSERPGGLWSFVGRKLLDKPDCPHNWVLWADPASVAIAGTIYRQQMKQAASQRAVYPGKLMVRLDDGFSGPTEIGSTW
jgi:hypothetical protein